MGNVSSCFSKAEGQVQVTDSTARCTFRIHMSTDLCSENEKKKDTSSKAVKIPKKE